MNELLRLPRGLLLKGQIGKTVTVYMSEHQIKMLFQLSD